MALRGQLSKPGGEQKRGVGKNAPFQAGKRKWPRRQSLGHGVRDHAPGFSEREFAGVRWRAAPSHFTRAAAGKGSDFRRRRVDWLWRRRRLRRLEREHDGGDGGGPSDSR